MSKWKFKDIYGDNTEYIFGVSPNEDGIATTGKNIHLTSTSAPYGNVIIQEGRASLPIISCSGQIITLSQLDAFRNWFSKRRIIQLTDDVGRVSQVYFSEFKPKRERIASNPHYYTYTMQFLVYSWAY